MWKEPRRSFKKSQNSYTGAKKINILAVQKLGDWKPHIQYTYCNCDPPPPELHRERK